MNKLPLTLLLEERSLWANVWCLWGDLTDDDGDIIVPGADDNCTGPGNGPVVDGGLLVSLGECGIGNFFSNSTDNNGKLNSGKSRP